MDEMKPVDEIDKQTYLHSINNCNGKLSAERSTESSTNNQGGPTGKIRGSHYPKFRPIITRGVCIHTWGPQSISGKICQRVVLTVDVEEDDRWDSESDIIMITNLK